jgi:hypothetical protein
MGLFSDQCQTCGAKVKKAAKFCSQCGALPPGGWWKCPGCRKWVGQESEFCPHCKAKLWSSQRGGIASGRWNPQPGMLSQRFHLANIRPLLEKELTVEAGSFAALLSGGAFLRVLEPGTYALKTLDDAEELLFVSSRETGLALRIDGLHTREDMSVDFIAELSLQTDPDKAEAFSCKLAEATLADLTGLVQKEAAHLLSNYCMESSIDELFKDPARRIRLETALKETLNGFLFDHGLTLVRLASMDFSGAAYEKLRTKNGAIEESRRTAELNLQMAGLVQSGKMDEFKNTHDLEQYVAQLAQERNLGGLERTQELDLLKQAHRHEMEAVEAGQKIRMAVHAREEKLKDVKLDVEIQHIKTDAEIEDTGKWLHVREQKNAVKNKQMADLAELAGKMDIQQLLAATDDPEKRKDLLKLHEQQRGT